jgi:hypothetical protein
MRRLTLAMVSVAVLVACAGTGSHSPTPPEGRRLEADFDQAWEAALRTLVQRGYNLRTADRSNGTMETDWLTFNPDYAATVFVTDHEDRYSLCGRPPLGQAYRTKQVRLVVTLQPGRPGETGLRTEAVFRTHRYSDTPLWSNRPLGDLECSSRGRLEEELRLEIQVRALSGEVERLRRGGR